jgi:RNA polymerase sigma factor (sigma-70 family)
MKSTSDTTRDPAPDDGGLAGAAFSEYSSELHRYLARRIARPEDADDLAQEVFLRLMRVEKPERVRKPVAYLFSVASHLIREFKLRSGREHEHLTYDSEAVEQAGETLSGGSNDEPAHRLNLERQLARGLMRLPPTHRTVLLLVKRDGMSHEEAAKAAGLSVHTVERYVIEATARMARMAWDR